MNLKKIIKETINNVEDDWSWAKFDPVEPRKEGEIRVGDVYTIYGNGYEIRYQLEVTEFLDDEVMYQLLITSDEEEEPSGSIQSTEFDNAQNLIRSGYWKLTSSFDVNLNESEEEDEWGWVKKHNVSIPITELKPNDEYKIIVTKVNEKTLTENKKKNDGFDWIRETNPDIKLEPNILYYFEPNIGGEELKNFIKRFAPGYKNLGRYLGGLKQLKYFVTDETGKNIQGWCYFTSLEEAMEYYEGVGVNYVYARDYFDI